jgi:4a-hydroxytetrahydrobiopterin dehydratase
MAKTEKHAGVSARKPGAPARLSESEVDVRLAELSEWGASGDQIQRTYQFSNFVESMSFVQQVALLAEQDQHHPDILIRYNKVTLSLSTHDAGGLTEKDFAAAKRYDAIIGKK